MNLSAHPELLSRIAAGYALGSLRGPARRRFEAMAREQPSVRAVALLWQSRMIGMTELQSASQPDPAVWTRIDNLLRAQAQEQAMQAARGAAPHRAGAGGWLRSLALWRVASATGVLATLLALVSGNSLQQEFALEREALQARLQAMPQIAYVAVLSDDQANPSMLVTFDPAKRTLTLQRVGGFREAADRSLQLWALPPSGGPRSLGVLGADQVLRLSAADQDVREVPTLAISLEPKGGVPSAGGPTGPVVFKGALIRKQS